MRRPHPMGRCRLEDDHADIRALLVRIERGEASGRELGPALEQHLSFEEVEVLPRLAERLPTGTGPIRTIHEDHRHIRGLLAHLVSGSPGPDVFGRLNDLLLAHFQKEEELILPFAHAHFCEEDLGRIGCAPTASDEGVTP